MLLGGDRRPVGHSCVRSDGECSSSSEWYKGATYELARRWTVTKLGRIKV